MKLGRLLQFYCCQGIAKFHMEIFIGQMHLTHTVKQSHVQCAETDFKRYCQTFIWRDTITFILYQRKADQVWVKLWCIISSKEYLLHAEPYCRVDTDLQDTGFGQGADVVLGLIEKCEVKAGSTVSFDNLFTSLPQLDDLHELGVGALGTLRLNRFHGATAANKTTLAKKLRGSHDFATYVKNLVLSWLDNKVVACTTNYITCDPVSTA